MRILLVLPLLLGCRAFEPPTCDDVDEFACFVGVFSDLVDQRVPDMQLCPLDLPDVPCVTTDEDGLFTLPGLPLDADVAVRAEHPDFVPVLFPQHTSFAWYAWKKVGVSPWVMDQNASRMDAELDPERGSLLFLAFEGLNLDGVDTPRVPDVTATLSTPGEVFYADGVGLASASATETTSSGSGGALNLPPGIAELTLTAPAGPCDEHGFSFAREPGEPIPVPILAGFVTAIDVICPVAR